MSDGSSVNRLWPGWVLSFRPLGILRQLLMIIVFVDQYFHYYVI